MTDPSVRVRTGGAGLALATVAPTTGLALATVGALAAGALATVGSLAAGALATVGPQLEAHWLAHQGARALEENTI